ncbi:MAG: hypothetical protein M3P23_05560 [Actinomycetota bacterium]|nr:hypothetical protein [Actinomycetota bacterium]
MVSSIAPDHPEATCRRCGGGNVTWYAPSPFWNAVMRDEEPRTRPEPYNGIVCPTCFCLLAVERGLADGFRVSAAKQPAELSLTTHATTGGQMVGDVIQGDVVSGRAGPGRVWDADRDLWVSS